MDGHEAIEALDRFLYKMRRRPEAAAVLASTSHVLRTYTLITGLGEINLPFFGTVDTFTWSFLLPFLSALHMRYTHDALRLA